MPNPSEGRLLITEQEVQLASERDPAPKNDNQALMRIIDKLVSNPQVDVDKLQKLLDMHERIRIEQARKAYAFDFVRMKPNLPRVVRSKKNEQTNSMYAPLEDVNEAIDPILQEHGFGSGSRVVSQTETGVTVEVQIWHREGHVQTTQVFMPLDLTGIKGTTNKTGPHATASSITYAKRVGLCALLNISTGDADGNTGEGDGHIDSGDLDEVLNWIASASAKELHPIFIKAYEKANNAKDRNSMSRLISAKNSRRKELGLCE